MRQTIVGQLLDQDHQSDAEDDLAPGRGGGWRRASPGIPPVRLAFPCSLGFPRMKNAAGVFHALRARQQGLEGRELPRQLPLEGVVEELRRLREQVPRVSPRRAVSACRVEGRVGRWRCGRVRLHRAGRMGVLRAGRKPQFFAEGPKALRSAPRSGTGCAGRRASAGHKQRQLVLSKHRNKVGVRYLGYQR